MFLGGVPARLLEAAAEFPAVVKRIAATKAETVTAELPLDSHVKAILDKLDKRYDPMPSTSMAPDPDAEPDLYEKWVANCGQRRNIHKHCLTCMKKPAAVGWRSRNPCEKRQASRRSWERRSRRRARSSGRSCGSYLRY